MKRPNYSKYIMRDKQCPKRECFVPFNGNGIAICRLYELGQCLVKYQTKEVNDGQH